MKFSIIINSHNQEKYLDQCITSCQKQIFRNFEIIIVDTSKIFNFYINKKYSSYSWINYYHYKSNYIKAELNQLDKVLFGFKKSVGDYLILVDGDDIIKKDKLSKINNLIIQKKFLINQDLPYIKNENSRNIIKMKMKKYKKNFIYKNLINNWPEIYGTSSICVKRNLLKEFYRIAKPFNWNNLAIDAQLILYSFFKYKTNYGGENLTIKRIHHNNLGLKYLNFFKQIFWERRYQQYRFCFFVRKRVFINADYLITSLINLILNLKKNVFR